MTVVFMYCSSTIFSIIAQCALWVLVLFSDFSAIDYRVFFRFTLHKSQRNRTDNVLRYTVQPNGGYKSVLSTISDPLWIFFNALCSVNQFIAWTKQQCNTIAYFRQKYVPEEGKKNSNSPEVMDLLVMSRTKLNTNIPTNNVKVSDLTHSFIKLDFWSKPLFSNSKLFLFNSFSFK